MNPFFSVQLELVTLDNIHLIQKRKCAFSELPYISIPNIFTPDIMHDMMEGIIPWVLKHTIIYLVKNKIMIYAPLISKKRYSELSKYDQILLIVSNFIL